MTSPSALPAAPPMNGDNPSQHDKSFPRLALFTILFFLALNIALSWWRYDMVPSVAGYDEAVINDGGVGFERFGVPRAPSMEGTTIGKFDAQYMPGFFVLQGMTFRFFGLTPLTLRLSAKIPHMAVCVLGLLILRRLWGTGVLSTRAATVVAILWLSDIAGFWVGRQGRMESLEELFGLSAAWVLLRRPDERRSWWLAAVLTGFAFSMHMTAILFWFPLLLGLCFYWRRLGWFTAVCCAAIPIAILGLMWLAAYRENAFAALTSFHTLNSTRHDAGFEFSRWVEFFSTLLSRRRLDRWSLAWLKPIGGISYLLTLAGWALVALRFREARTNRWIAFAISCSVAHALCAQFITGVLAQRMVLYYPFALLAIGLVVTRYGIGWQRAALSLSLLIAIVQFSTMASYANLPGDRSPDRYASLPLPAGVQTVAGTSELWYYFVSRNRPFSMIIPDSYWKLHPERLDEFDAVILPEGDPMLSWPQLASRPRRLFTDYTGTLVICLKPQLAGPG